MKRVATAMAAQAMAAKASQLAAELDERRGDHDLAAARHSLAADLGREVAPAESADVLAQAVVCATPILDGFDSTAIRWLSESAACWEQWVLEAAAKSSTKYSVLSTQDSIDPRHIYDQFLHAFAPTSRKRHGVFFTPPPIADYIVRQIDHALTHDLNLSNGLSSHSALRIPNSALKFLDPACGTGVFLLALIDHLQRRLQGGWNDFVPDLLPRLAGIELLPVPAFLAKLNIALKLAVSGYDFRQPGRIDIRIGDALCPNPQFAIRNPQFAIPILLGNPPFSSLSTNTNPWIAELVRGSDEVRGYIVAGEHRLDERKTWLHDDYVKFIRLAQWHVEQAGQGIIGFVTSRSYFDNATFRLMRRELMRVFPHIRLVDLHGSRKGGDVAPDGSRDENVFGLDQGVAIAILARGASEGPARLAYDELWGARDAKLAALARGKRDQASGGREAPEDRCVRTLVPHAPHWLFVPTTTASHPEYAAAWSLAEAMPVNTTAPVTARDHFVVAFTRVELHQRIGEFRDLSIPDEAIRQKYFARTRSSRYPLGDTRGWKLANARRLVAADEDWQAKIIRCLYRPFDWRHVFWHHAMIDWPRREVTRHLIGDPADKGQKRVNQIRNLCLIARRQQLPGRQCTFFWIADGLALDGVIRSDNRGSESLFPLQVDSACRAEPEQTREVELSEQGNLDEEAPLGRSSLEANFDPRFFEQARVLARGGLRAEDLLAYIYALFHSPTYRERYAYELRLDFPRVLLPAKSELLDEMAGLGRRLIEAHLLRVYKGSGVNCGDDSPEALILNATDSRPRDVKFGADLRVGGYLALRKWLQPKHRSTSDGAYRQIKVAIEHTHRLAAAVDAVIDRHGGFPAAFAK